MYKYIRRTWQWELPCILIIRAGVNLIFQSVGEVNPRRKEANESASHSILSISLSPSIYPSIHLFFFFFYPENLSSSFKGLIFFFYYYLIWFLPRSLETSGSFGSRSGANAEQLKSLWCWFIALGVVGLSSISMHRLSCICWLILQLFGRFIWKYWFIEMLEGFLFVYFIFRDSWQRRNGWNGP